MHTCVCIHTYIHTYMHACVLFIFSHMHARVIVYFFKCPFFHFISGHLLIYMYVYKSQISTNFFLFSPAKINLRTLQEGALEDLCPEVNKICNFNLRCDHIAETHGCTD
jgi:hypothetical protein